ncbi:MAG: hypothetical protein HKO59_10305 [Phycisphaerales bacterium]|nr:hypothetical protein [Phycisphaerales bacterium]NNM26356.1 hypothetical protein [Phycisphaerales bacterium]
MISLGILAALLMGALAAFGTMTRSDSRLADREIAMAFAHDLLGEILQAHYTDPEVAATNGPPSFGLEADELPGAGDRLLYDDVDDYHDMVETPLRSRDGTILDGANGMERRVTVEFVDPDLLMGPGSQDPIAETGLKRVTVAVSLANGPTVHVRGLRGMYSTAETVPSVESTYVRSIEVRLQLGADAVPLTSGTTLLNQIALENAP